MAIRNLNRLALIVPLLLVVFGLTGCPLFEDMVGDSFEATTIEQDAVARVNVVRQENGAAPLIERADLSAVARAHSADMAARDYFSHFSPEGTDVADRLDGAGIFWTLAGENIAFNNFDNPAETAVEAWVNSPGHYLNIVETRYTHTGMGVARAGDVYYFTQVFIREGDDSEVKMRVLLQPE